MPPGSRTYTARDRIYAWARSSDGSFNVVENARGEFYWYDAEGQLTDAAYQVQNALTAPTDWQREEHFQYDQLGNRKQVARYGNSWQQWTRRDNGLNQIKDTPPWAGWVTHEDSYAPQSPGHNNGNLVTDGYMSANYNALNQPNWMYGNARASGNSLNFGHDPLGRCVIRWDSLGSTYLYYDGWNLITEGSRFDQPIRQYIHGARVDEIVWSKVVTSGVVAYHHYDARTHCMMLTGTGQNIIEQYDYDAFGRVYAYNATGAALTVGGRPGSPFGNRFLFTGREWLWDLGMYDYRHRHYNPELGRFLQPDPKHFGAGDYNLYRYCHNDPVNTCDPFGLVEVEIAFRAFIPQATILNYHGDNRSFTTDSGASSRVAVTIRVETDSSKNGGSAVVGTPSIIISPTRNSSSEEKTATGPLLPSVGVSRDADGNVSVGIGMNVRNPLAPQVGSGIMSNVSIGVNANGTQGSVTGTISRTPSFEANFTTAGGSVNVPLQEAPKSTIPFALGLQRTNQINKKTRLP